jgi:hypothetical protein
MPRIEFTDNYQDLSTQTGFQFKFFCESCGNGYMSSWQANKTGMAGTVIRGLGNVFGGVLGSAAAGSYEIQEAVGGPAHDKALEEAVTEIRALFNQCKRCGQWVCGEVCWNHERNLCSHCAPIMQRELSAAQAAIAVDQMTEKLREQDLTAGLNLTSIAVVQCPQCGVEADGGKFCQECGSSLAPRTECSRCGASFEPGAKFCQECGQNLS